MASYLLSSCRNNKVANCREIMNFSARLDREIKENLQTQNIENVINVAKRFENTAQEIKEIKITDEQLKIYSQELADVYQNYARSTHNFIQAFREKDREQAIFYKNQVNKLFEQQQQLVSSINSYCQP
jgi:histidinol dehydrogenase